MKDDCTKNGTKKISVADSNSVRSGDHEVEAQTRSDDAEPGAPLTELREPERQASSPIATPPGEAELFYRLAWWFQYRWWGLRIERE